MYWYTWVWMQENNNHCSSSNTSSLGFFEHVWERQSLSLDWVQKSGLVSSVSEISGSASLHNRIKNSHCFAWIFNMDYWDEIQNLFYAQQALYQQNHLSPDFWSWCFSLEIQNAQLCPSAVHALGFSQWMTTTSRAI